MSSFSKWFKNLKTGYYVSTYNRNLDNWIRADETYDGRWLVTMNNWSIKISASSGYDSIFIAEEWFNYLKG